MAVSLNRVSGIENLRTKVEEEFFHMFLVRLRAPFCCFEHIPVYYNERFCPPHLKAFL